MLKILVALVIIGAIFHVAVTLSGTAIQSGSAPVKTLGGPDRGTLQFVP